MMTLSVDTTIVELCDISASIAVVRVVRADDLVNVAVVPRFLPNDIEVVAIYPSRDIKLRFPYLRIYPFRLWSLDCQSAIAIGTGFKVSGTVSSLDCL